MHIAPQAILDDGLLQCVLVRGLSTLEIMRYLPSLFQGKHLKHSPFDTLNACEIEVTVTQETHLEMDGEPVLSLSPRDKGYIKSLPQALLIHAHDRALGLSKHDRP